MTDALTLADKLWHGEADISEFHPISYSGNLTEIADGVAFLPSFANVSLFSSGDGLTLIDTGSPMFAGSNFEKIRAWSAVPVERAVYTHGHIDHVFGLGLQRHVDPVTKKESFVFSCFNQDQHLDEVDFTNLRARLRQNTVLEKLTNLWLTRALAENRGTMVV